MIVHLFAVLVFQGQAAPALQLSDSAQLARARDHDDSARVLRRMARRVPVTAEHLTTAFRDPPAKELLLDARAARIRQDSSLHSYDATTYQRVSVGMGFRQIGRDRLLMRSESATRARWSRDVGAWVDVLGRRSVFPMVREAEGDMEMDEASALPYYPGREQLWIGGGLMKAEVDPTEFVHPLAAGSEAYYNYETGDSLRLELGGGRAVRLRELRVVARKPQWNLIVGSFWFDVSSGQLVRAAYRPAVPMDIWQVATADDPESMDDVPILVKPLITPMTATVNAITIEYGLFSGIWMPRLRTIDANARVSFMRMPVRFEERFRYTSVNALDTTLTPIEVTRRQSIRRDTLSPGALDSMRLADSVARADSWEMRDEMEVNIGVRVGSGDGVPRPQRDSIRREIRARMLEIRELPPAERDSVRAHYNRVTRENSDSMRMALLESFRVRQTRCDSTGFRVRTYNRFHGTLKVARRVPCDESILATSPELPASIYDPGEEIFGEGDRDALIKALDFGLQAGWGPQKPSLHYGLADGVWRYNRVEGVSLGIAADAELGMGYAASAKARYAFASQRPFAELGIARSTGRRTISLSAYRRVATADDWGSPFSFGASLASMLYARDEGFYYQTLGGEMIWRHGTSGVFQWRTFAERQRTAPWATKWSLFGGRNDSRFIPNFTALHADVAGSEARVRRTFGLDPDRFRLNTDIRVEGGLLHPVAGSDLGYARGAADLTLSRPIARRLATSLGVAGGASAGTLPAQRMWRLGGLQSVRGQAAGTMTGDAFWVAHAELGGRITTARPVIFYDAGWAGSRDLFGKSVRPISGAGIGSSFLDGLIRFDVSRGIWPSNKYRVDFYVEARF